jgi:phosphoenolpyruvate synthase/pyruvate phosphate dikinase
MTSATSIQRMFSFEFHHKRVYLFSEGSSRDIRLLGQKGAALCELTQLGLPVPPGFIITTENFLEYDKQNHHQSQSQQSHRHDQSHHHHDNSAEKNESKTGIGCVPTHSSHSSHEGKSNY